VKIPKMNALPINEKATGKPKKIRKNKAGNINKESIIFFPYFLL
tara:strand:- start:1525 stop:1656 length:132 start_codon:yes stop_codon:yes gene_type:complete